MVRICDIEIIIFVRAQIGLVLIHHGNLQWWPDVCEANACQRAAVFEGHELAS